MVYMIKKAEEDRTMGSDLDGAAEFGERMKQMTSSEFRVKYQQLTEPHEITALGRVIGVWTPVAPVPYTVPDWDQPLKLEFRPVPKPKGKVRVGRGTARPE